MKTSLKLSFFIILLLLGAVCGLVAGMAADLIQIEVQDTLKYAGVGSVFGFINFLLVLSLYPKEGKVSSKGSFGDRGGGKDAVTGILDGKAFERAMAGVRDPLYSLIIMDVDGFKAYRDEHGTQGAESLLKIIGKAIKSSIRSDDGVYHYEGDIFSAYLANCGKDKAIEIAEKIRVRVSNLDNSPFPGATVSAAVVSFPEDGDTAGDLVKVSEELMQSAKKSGKNSTFALARGKIN